MSKSKAAWGSESSPTEQEKQQPRVYDWAAKAGAFAAPLGPESERRGGRAEDVGNGDADSDEKESKKDRPTDSQ